VKAVASGDEIAVQSVPGTVLLVAYLGVLGIEVMHRNITGLVHRGQPRCLPGGHQIPGDFCLTVDHDLLPACERMEVNAVALAAEEQIKAGMGQSFLMHARANASFVQQVGGDLFQHPGAYAREHVISALTLQNHVGYACFVQQLTEQKSGWPRSNDGDLSPHVVSFKEMEVSVESRRLGSHHTDFNFVRLLELLCECRAKAESSHAKNPKTDPALSIAKADLIAGMAKGMAVLESFDTERQRLNATLAAQRAGITRAAARRHLLTLASLGYLESDGSYFWLSSKVLRFSGTYLSSARFPRAVQPTLNRLAAQTQESFSAVVLDGSEVVIVARSGNDWRSSRHRQNPGARPMACTWARDCRPMPLPPGASCWQDSASPN